MQVKWGGCIQVKERLTQKRQRSAHGSVLEVDSTAKKKQTKKNPSDVQQFVGINASRPCSAGLRLYTNSGDWQVRWLAGIVFLPSRGKITLSRTITIQKLLQLYLARWITRLTSRWISIKDLMLLVCKQGLFSFSPLTLVEFNSIPELFQETYKIQIFIRFNKLTSLRQRHWNIFRSQGQFLKKFNHRKVDPVLK